MNAPLLQCIGELAQQLYGGDDPRSLDAVTRAVVDLPYAVVRRHARADVLPSWLEDDVAAAVRALLTGYRP